MQCLMYPVHMSLHEQLSWKAEELHLGDGFSFPLYPSRPVGSFKEARKTWQRAVPRKRPCI